MTLNLTPKEEKRTVRCLLSTVFYDEISVIRETSDSTIVTNSATMLKTCKKNRRKHENFHKEYTVTSCPVKCSGTKAVLTSLALSAFLLPTATCLAESVATAEWNISADKITRYEDPRSIVAEGNIILEKRVKIPPKAIPVDTEVTEWAELLDEKTPQQEITAEEIVELTDVEEQVKTTLVIKADWLTYDVDMQSIKAKGNVEVSSEDDTLMADEGSVKLDTETGSFTDAIIIRKEDSLHLEGKTIEKTGLNTYHIQEGWVITCKVDEGKTPPWSFASKDTTIKQDGYAVMKHATFNVKGVPIFYTPYMIVPVKNTRQTGFLFPEASNSGSGGFSFNVPFFINLSNSMDITLFPEIYFDRGFMPGAEFRYVRNENNKGVFTGSYLNDSLSGTDQSTEYYVDTGYSHTNSDRYWVRAKADHTIGDNWQTRLDVDIVSDKDYLSEFNSGYTGFDDTDDRFQEVFGRGFENKTDTTRQNTLKFLKSWSGISLETNLLAINDVREDETNPTPLWKLPDIQFSGVLPVSTTGISFEWDADYVNYWREDGIGAHRFDIHPNISSSIPLSPYLESRAELGIRETYYIVQEYGDSTWDKDDTQDRLTANFEFEVSSTVMRNFALSGESFDSVDHLMQPFVKYEYIPDVDQDDLPQFDSVDTISEANQITYGIDNFFNVFSGTATREYGYFKINQSYSLLDPEDGEEDEPFSDVQIQLAVTPIEKLHFEYDTNIDVYGDGFVRHSFEGQYTNSRGDFFSVDYSFTKDSVEQINATIHADLSAKWATELEVEHSISESETNVANFSLLYTELCWSVKMQTKYTPSDTTFLVVFNLANIGMPFGASF